MDFKEAIQDIYQDLFQRIPDAPGLRFYLQGLESGRFSMQSLEQNIMDGARDARMPDATALENRLIQDRLYTAMSVEQAADSEIMLNEGRTGLRLTGDGVLHLEELISQGVDKLYMEEGVRLYAEQNDLEKLVRLDGDGTLCLLEKPAGLDRSVIGGHIKISGPGRETYKWDLPSSLLEKHAPIISMTHNKTQYLPTRIEGFLEHAVLYRKDTASGYAEYTVMGKGSSVAGNSEKMLDQEGSVIEVDAVVINLETVEDIYARIAREENVHSYDSFSDIAQEISDHTDYFLDFLNYGKYSQRTENFRDNIDVFLWLKSASSENDAQAQVLSFDDLAVQEIQGPAVYARKIEAEDIIYLQYYLYYLKDDASDYIPALGYPFGAHESDWEFFQAALHKNGRIDYESSVHYSATSRHYFPFVEDHAYQLEYQAGTNPVIFPADGSHAVYFSEGSTRVGLSGQENLFLGINDVRGALEDTNLLVPGFMDMHRMDITSGKNHILSGEYYTEYIPSKDLDTVYRDDEKAEDVSSEHLPKFLNYDLIDIDSSKEVTDWLKIDMRWGPDLGTPWGNAPPSPVYMEKYGYDSLYGRWQEPVRWMGQKELVDHPAAGDDIIA